MTPGARLERFLPHERDAERNQHQRHRCATDELQRPHEPRRLRKRERGKHHTERGAQHDGVDHRLQDEPTNVETLLPRSVEHAHDDRRHHHQLQHQERRHLTTVANHVHGNRQTNVVDVGVHPAVGGDHQLPNVTCTQRAHHNPTPAAHDDHADDMRREGDRDNLGEIGLRQHGEQQRGTGRVERHLVE